MNEATRGSAPCGTTGRFFTLGVLYPAGTVNCGLTFDRKEVVLVLRPGCCAIELAPAPKIIASDRREIDQSLALVASTRRLSEHALICRSPLAPTAIRFT
jgi:hypothetical protein